MEYLLVPIFYALPYAGAFAAAIGVVALGGLALRSPWFLILPFLAALFWLSENRYGLLEASSGPTLLSRGSGVLLFPAFLWSMLIALAWIRFGGLFSRLAKPAAPTLPLTPWFAAWALLLLMHLAVAAAQGVPFKQALAPSGFSYIPWLWVLIATMVAAVARPVDANRIAVFIMGMGLARALFGLVRFAAFGGDPANAYANRQGLSLKLTFFDVNDSLLCSLAICIALVMLYRAAPARGWLWWQRLLLWAVVAVPALCIVLSFRRTAWLGTLLALGFVLLQLPARVRWRLVLLAMPVMLSGIGYAAWKRVSQVRGPTGGFLYDLMPGTTGAESMRVLELRLAWQSFLDNPFFGVGSWGGYGGWQQISWQFEFGEGGGGKFLHSAVLHLALKSGLVGIVLLVGTVTAFVLAWRRMRPNLPAAALPLAVAGVANVLFVLPDWLVGTPIPQVRTMMLLGVCLGLPFVAQRCFSGHLAPVGALPRTADVLGLRAGSRLAPR